MNKQSKIKKPGRIRLHDSHRVWKLIPATKKPEALILLGMMILGMFLEMLGVGLVLPVITIVSKPELLNEYPIFNQLMELAGNPDKAELMLWAMGLLVIIYTIKNLFLAFLAWKQSKFVFSTQAEMAKMLFRGYLHQPYTFHLQRNSADLINNLQVELNLFMNYMLSPGMLFITESMVILGLVSLLLYFEPVGSLTVFSLFVIVGGLFQWLTKKRIIQWGKLRQEHEVLRMKHAQQGIGAIKDVKVSGTESFFINEYEKNSEMSLSMHQKNSFVQNITRLWLEVLAISGLFVLCLGMFLQSGTVSEILPVLGLFGAVSFRLMPSISRIVSSLNSLRFGTSITDVIQAEVNQINATDSTAPENFQDMNFDREVAFSGVSYRYPSSHNNVLDNVNLTIRKGTMVGFIGPSGAGKSTLIDILMGLLPPTQGQLQVDGKKVSQSNVRAWQRLIGYVPQSIYLIDDTLEKNIAFGLDSEDINKIALNKAISAAQLDSLVDELPEGIHTLLGENGVRLSGGQRQRVGIARALYHDPSILVLDEATSALDSSTEKEVMSAVASLQGHKTIIAIAHRVSTLISADELFAVKNGQVDRIVSD